ncbi:MAG: hypothetical protein AAGC55_32980, partial [Myxococcota bacterium]
GELTVSEQERVSACLLSRSNAEGRLVNINLVGTMVGFDSLSDSDLASYPHEEAVFFGNLFLDEPVAYACAGSAVTQAEQLRACTLSDGELDCGIIAPVDGGEHTMASCSDICDTTVTDDGSVIYSSCTGPDRVWSEVLTSYVQYDPAN